MSFVRTFGRLRPSKDVLGISVKITSQSTARVTDIQMMPGSSLFSWSPQVGDLHLRASRRWRFINGIIQSDYDTWVVSDEDQASPYRGILHPLGSQKVRWGMVELGTISSPQELDGHDYKLTSGAGVTPHHTARADQRLDLVTTGLLSAMVAIRGIHSDPGDPPLRNDLGRVTEAHAAGWGSVWAWHNSWNDVLANHGGW